MVRLKGVEEDISKEAFSLVKGLVRGEEDLPRLDDHRTGLLLRSDALSEQIETQRMQLAVLERDRLQKLHYVSKTNSRAMERAQSALSNVEQVTDAVDSITNGIVRLDIAQRNLTSTITMLRRFQSMVESMSRLERMLMAGDFAQMASVLLATQQFAEQFVSLRGGGTTMVISLVADSLARLDQLQKMLQRHISELFEDTLSRRSGEIRRDRAHILGQAAIVMDVLGGDARTTLISWYCTRQLTDYKEVFRANPELASLESLAKRFAWLKRLLIHYEAEHALIFPNDWHVERALCMHFCTITSKDLADILQRHASNLDLSVLHAVVQQTRSFEEYLQRRFSVPEGGGTQREMGLCMSTVFEPYLIRIVEAHDREIARVLSQLPKGKTLSPNGADFDSTGLLTSAPDLFLLFRDILHDMATLSRRKTLLDLANVFIKHLSSYGKYIEGLLSFFPSQNSNSNSSSKISTAAIISDLKILCHLINTLDYCQITMGQMEESMRPLVSKQYRDGIIFDSVKQEFLILVTVAISKLHTILLDRTLSVWTAMAAGGGGGVVWAELRAVGDQSPYVVQLGKILLEMLPSIRGALISPKHYAAICDRVVGSVARQFYQGFLRIRPMGDLVAQQLLVDLESLRRILLQLLRPSDLEAIRNLFTKLVTRELRDSEVLLKAILAPAHPPHQFVQNYLLIAADSNEAKLGLLLDLKGIKKTAQTPYLEEFRKHVPITPSAANSTGTVSALPRRELKFFRIDEQLRKVIQSTLANALPSSG